MKMFKLIDAKGAVQRVSDGAMIPEDEQNTDWLGYKEWLKSDQPEAYTPPPPAPREISARAVIAAIPAAALLAMRTYADTRLAAGKTGEWAYLYQEPQWLEVNPKLIRLLAAGGLEASALFDLAAG